MWTIKHGPITRNISQNVESNCKTSDFKKERTGNEVKFLEIFEIGCQELVWAF